MKTGTPFGNLGPSEQRTGDLDPPMAGGGRRADLPADYQQHQMADRDRAAQMRRNAKLDRRGQVQMRALDATPWQKSNREG